MNVRNTAIISLALVMAGPVWAQTRTAAPRASSDAPTKIAVINFQGAIGQTVEGKQAIQQLQTKFAARTSQLQDLANKIQSIQKQAQDGANTLSDAAKSQLAQEYQLDSRQYQRQQQELNQDEQDAQADVVDSMSLKMQRVINQYASGHGYSIVLDTSSQSMPILYASTGVDITDAVVKLYDQTYPSAARTTPAPKK